MTNGLVRLRALRGGAGFAEALELGPWVAADGVAARGDGAELTDEVSWRPWPEPA
jgi:hypothetical protein